MIQNLESVLVDQDRDVLVGMAQADLEPLAADLDLAALQIPAGRDQHLQLHRPPIGRRRGWVHIAGHHQARLAWAALARAEPEAGTAIASA